MIEDVPVAFTADEQKKLELRFRLVKDEVALQSNIFDQIDSKTGVALGFMFVVIGQVLAVVFRMAIERSQIHSAFPDAFNSMFADANLFALLAIGCGVKARWPREFQHSIEFSEDELLLTYSGMLDVALESFLAIYSANQTAIKNKHRWATGTYVFFGLALVTYLALTLFLYFFSPRA